MRSLAAAALVPMLIQSCDNDADSAASAMPSGLDHQLFEALDDKSPDGKKVLRLRYVATELEADSFDKVSEDFAALCARDVLPRQRDAVDPYDQAVISLSNKKSEFGVFNPDVTQYFEAFRLENGTCIWEAF